MSGTSVHWGGGLRAGGYPRGRPACVSWRSAQHHPGLLPSWQACTGQALTAPQGAEYGFGLLSGQIKQQLKLREQSGLTNKHLQMPYHSPILPLSATLAFQSLFVPR